MCLTLTDPQAKYKGTCNTGLEIHDLNFRKNYSSHSVTCDKLTTVVILSRYLFYHVTPAGSGPNHDIMTVRRPAIVIWLQHMSEL